MFTAIKLKLQWLAVQMALNFLPNSGGIADMGGTLPWFDPVACDPMPT